MAILEVDSSATPGLYYRKHTMWPAAVLVEAMSYSLAWTPSSSCTILLIYTVLLLLLYFYLCSNGVGRTGTFATIYAGVQEINKGAGIIDILDTIIKLRQRRKHMVHDKQQLKFCYTTILYCAQDVLLKSKYWCFSILYYDMIMWIDMESYIFFLHRFDRVSLLEDTLFIAYQCCLQNNQCNQFVQIWPQHNIYIWLKRSGYEICCLQFIIPCLYHIKSINIFLSILK